MPLRLKAPFKCPTSEQDIGEVVKEQFSRGMDAVAASGLENYLRVCFREDSLSWIFVELSLSCEVDFL